VRLAFVNSPGALLFTMPRGVLTAGYASVAIVLFMVVRATIPGPVVPDVGYGLVHILHLNRK
jgi:hypothetical protein